MSPFFTKRRLGKTSSFTLVEMLTVILIIAILMAITIMASEGVLNAAARSRARAEIAAIGSALENYKTDNAIYPANDMGAPSSYLDSSSYTNGAQVVYQALTGLTNFTDTPSPGQTNYMSFKISQVSGTNQTGIQDPFGNAYGYSTGDSTNVSDAPYNGVGFYDLWSTAGVLSNAANATNSWISNWNQ